VSLREQNASKGEIRKTDLGGSLIHSLQGEVNEAKVIGGGEEGFGRVVRKSRKEQQNYLDLKQVC